MNYFSYFLTLFLCVKIKDSYATLCGCKTTRPCYMDMVNTLKDRDEESCIEDASIGASTIMIFLKAIKQFCPDQIEIDDDSLTHEGRYLYEVILSNSNPASKDKTKDKSSKVLREPKSDKPTIMIEAGQDAGTESVEMALFIVEQLVACQENNEMLNKANWVILPSTNPDGLEFSRYNRVIWKKNVKPSEDNLSFGVDITRNFEYKWDNCEKVEATFSPDYPGPAAESEAESMFIKNALSKHKDNLKLYLSLRRNGHAILYPYAYHDSKPGNKNQLVKVAADMAAKVNQRASGVQVFMNTSIFENNGKPHCGHSVDLAHDMGIPLAFEMRVFLADDFRILSMFQQMPRGYETSLRLGYFSGIRDLYNAVVNEKKRKHSFK